MSLLFLLASLFLCELVLSSFAICPRDQSLALVEFNQSFVVDASASFICDKQSYPKTSSWNMNKDCCSWDGIICDEMTGHVIELDLSCSQLVGKIDSNSSLFQLSHLQRLNLSINDFDGSHISPKFGRLASLTHLDLSRADFSGQIPSEISHLSKLKSVSLSYNSELRLVAYDFKMYLQNLTQLRELHLSGVNISSTIPLNFSSHLTTLGLTSTGVYGKIPESIFNLPNLETLDLSYNDQLNGYFPKTKWNSSASLMELNLAGVNFSGNFLPECLGYLTSLQRLVLSSCNLSGQVPKSLWNLTHLEYMDFEDNRLEGPIFPQFTSGLQYLNTLSLSNNSLNGEIPSWIFSLPLLSELDLSNNHFSGQLKEFSNNSVLVRVDISENEMQGCLPKSIQNLVSLVSISLANNQLQCPLPKSLQNLRNLKYFDLLSNNFSGSVDVSVFSNLKQLWYLDLSYNSISLINENKVKSTLPQSLEYLYLAACQVKELDFLRSAKNFYTLDLSYNNIQGTIPDVVLSNWMHSIKNLNLAHNMLTSIDHISSFSQLISINLLSNSLQGTLPIPPPSIEFFFMSNNNVSGKIPSSICNLTTLKILDLSNNNLKGEIPQCLGNMSDQLEVLDMQRNSLSGSLQTTFSSGSKLKSFNLHGNNLEGKLPRSLANCKELEVLDLGNNQLNDTFPIWLGTLPNLQVLSLRLNNLHGPIRTSTSLKLFPQLRMLDLSRNAFTAELPTSLFRNLKAMRRIDKTMKDTTQIYYQNSLIVATKGLEFEVVRILSLYTTMDLSNNEFEGHIPSMLGDLIALRVLNLSHNELQGHIPPSLGKLSVVESLDLSYNRLSGEIPKQGTLPIPPPSIEYFLMSNNNVSGKIPSSICNLTTLKILDLSNNNLMGEIPQCLGNMSDQLEVLDMRHNSLSGSLQTTFSSGSKLKSFNLHGNNLEGKLPRSLANCKELEVLDLGNNQLNDTFPMWLGTLPNLQVLSLRSNNLHGPIRTSTSSKLFPQLRMIDLSSNAFTADLPTSLFRNLNAMRRTNQTMKALVDTTQIYYQNQVTVVTKGLVLEVVRILSLYTTMDLSNNKFEGHIPSMLGDLIALRVLNLSHNELQGHIPPSLGKLSVVESLDLSSNRLSGEIPKQLVSLTSLAVLNLSRNHLEGCIPKGNQFDTFGNNSYEGNDGLRGFPVSGGCGSGRIPETNNTTFVPDEENDSTFLSELSWKVVLMGYGTGLIIGFSIAYLMLSSRNPNWLSGIAEDLEYRIIMRRRKKQRGQMHYRRRRRNNGI